MLKLVELDRCEFSFTADEECIYKKVQEDAIVTEEVARALESDGNESSLTTPEGIAVNDAVHNYPMPVDQVRVVAVDENHRAVEAQVVVEDDIVIVEVYVNIMISVQTIIKRIVNGVVTTDVIMQNMWITSVQYIEQIVSNPSLINDVESTPAGLADAMIVAAVNRPVVGSLSVDICGKPMDCPPDNPTWTRSQQIACQELHSTLFFNKRRAELEMGKIDVNDLIGQFKPMTFHGYCMGPGPVNYIGFKDGQVAQKEEWQTICEPMTCPYGSFVTPSCECSPVDDPCAACPSGTRCQMSPTLMCIDCECGTCSNDDSPCCAS